MSPHTQKIASRDSIPNPAPPKKEKTMRIKPYKPRRIFLETLIGYIEAAKCKTLDNWRE